MRRRGGRSDTRTMTSHTTPAPAGHPRTASPRQLQWLRAELAGWRDDGLLEAAQAEAVLARYRTSRRLSIGRLLLMLGAGFTGVGVLWLVAANLEQMGQVTRLLLVSLLWLGLVIGGELLAGRAAHRSAVSSTLVLALRTLASVVLGAVVLQAAQSLQVPAWEASLVGWWAAGALVHAYAVRSVGPLLVGVATGLTWFLWHVLEQEPSGLAAVLAVLAGAALAVGLAALHSRAYPEFASPWREVGAALALAGLFAAALPSVTPGRLAWEPWLVAGLAVAAAAVAGGCAATRGRDRLEPLAAAGVAVLAVLLVLWDTGDSGIPTAGDWLHAVVSVLVYVVVAISVSVVGTLRDSRTLTALGTAGIVVFTTVQSFAVFARIIQGAWLFVALGLVFLATGVVFDRARRGLVGAVQAAGERS